MNSCFLFRMLLIGSLFLSYGIVGANTIQNNGDSFPAYKINKALYKACKKARSGDSLESEGFFIVSIPNPYSKFSGSIISSSDDVLKRLGEKVLIKIDEKKFPKIQESIKEIIMPVINTHKCRKHPVPKDSEYKRIINAYLEEKYPNKDSSIAILNGMSFIQLGHPNK